MDDSNANRTSFRERDGSTLTYQYDGLNRMTAKFVPERAGLAAAQTRDVYYAYDLRGLQTEARFDSLAGEGVTNVFDGFGGLTSSSSNMGGIARAVGNLYDLDGNRIRIIHPDTSFFTYEHDGLDRPFRIRENGGDPIAAFAFDSGGRRASSGWAATTSYGYDPIGRLWILSHDLAGTSRDLELVFDYNPASQIVSRSASNDAFAWTDPARYARSYTANGLNQYTGTTSTGAPAVSFLYDANGNLTSDGLHSFVYDIENRLVSATGAHNAELVYDPLGRLFQVSSGGAGIRRSSLRSKSFQSWLDTRLRVNRNGCFRKRGCLTKRRSPFRLRARLNKASTSRTSRFPSPSPKAGPRPAAMGRRGRPTG